MSLESVPLFLDELFNCKTMDLSMESSLCESLLIGLDTDGHYRSRGFHNATHQVFNKVDLRQPLKVAITCHAMVNARHHEHIEALPTIDKCFCEAHSVGGVNIPI